MSERASERLSMFVALLLVVAAVVAALVLVVASAGRAAASAAAAAARHAGCVCSFFFPHNADVSSTDFFSRIWAEPANITHLEWCLRGDRCVHGARVTRA